jgi:3-oxoacyl-[acyl-carrier protein] reductase
MNLQLTDHVAFIAGSSRGIGRAIAAELLSEGARVVLTGRDEDSLAQTNSELAKADTYERILPIAGDFTQPEAIAAAFDRTIRHYGRIDHLIANLGTGSGTPGPNPPKEDWVRLFEVNFFASVRLTQAALEHLAASRGSILYISSIVAVESTPAPLPYSAAKAALNNYAKNLSRQLAPQNIRVNTICPGNIFFFGGSWEKHLANEPAAVEAMLKSEVPQNRFGTPDEIASLAAYLCSPLAAFSTGGTYVMDGGQTRSL